MVVNVDRIYTQERPLVFRCKKLALAAAPSLAISGAITQHRISIPVTECTESYGRFPGYTAETSISTAAMLKSATTAKVGRI